MLLWLRKQFWENCRKKTTRCGKVYAPSSETFQKQKKWQKKVIPIDAPLDIQIAILITLTKILADSPRKLRSIPNFFLLCSYPQKAFYRTSLWDTIWQPASVFQQMNEILSSKRENKYTKEKISQNFFPASCSFGGFECCYLTHPDQRFCRKDGKLSLKCQFFFFCCPGKVFLGLFSGARLSNLLPFTDKKTKFHASSSKTKKNKIEVFSRKVFSVPQIDLFVVVNAGL